MITTSCVRVRGVCVCVVWRISVLSVVPPTMFASPEYNVRLFIAVDIVVDGFDGVRARVACHNRLGKCDYPKYGFGRNNFVCVELWSCGAVYGTRFLYFILSSLHFVLMPKRLNTSTSV